MSNKNNTKNVEISILSSLAIEYMKSWAEASIKPSQNRGLVEKYMDNASEQKLLLACAHIRKFDCFPFETVFHLICNKIDAKELAEIKEYLKSKKRLMKPALSKSALAK